MSYELLATSASLKNEPQRQLRLTRIADAHAEKAAEIEERRGTERVEIVLVVEGIKDFCARFEGPPAVVELEGTSHAEVRHEEALSLRKWFRPQSIPSTNCVGVLPVCWRAGRCAIGVRAIPA